MPTLTYHGHSCFQLQTGKYNLIIDPFITGNPVCKIKSGDVKADYIILTHAHEDHFGDTIELAKSNNATVIAVHELANYISSEGCTAHGMGIGGQWNFPFGRIKYTIAHHSSSFGGAYMGDPAGVIITTEGKSIYHAGDTSLFLDMKLIGDITPLDLAILPIGDNYTMGVDDAVKAVEFLNPKQTVPCHYNTWELIKADANEFKRKVESIGKNCSIMNPEDTLEI